MLVSEVQSAKQFLPIEVTLFGIVMLASEVQLEKTPEVYLLEPGNSVMLLESFTSFRDRQ